MVQSSGGLESLPYVPAAVIELPQSFLHWFITLTSERCWTDFALQTFTSQIYHNIYWYIVIYWAGYRIYQHNLSTLSNLTRKCTCVSGEVGNIVRTAELLGIYSGAETSACAEIGFSKFR